jgi:alpha-methylacyl-CoA racemase
LIGCADALIEGARPGVMERLGLGPDDCLQRNAALVYARVTGWGQTGPLATTAGHDINYIALTGALHAIGAAGDPPTVPLNLLGDYAGGSLFACLGIVSAILSARQNGRGQVVDVAMVDGVATMMSLFHALRAAGLWRDARGCNLLDGSAPFYRCYACADGKAVAVGALERPFFARLVDGLAIDVPHAQYDSSQWPAMTALFEQRFAERTRDEWEKVFAGSDACVTPVLSIAESLDHPVNVERGVFTDIGGVRQAASAPRFSLGLPPIRTPEETDVGKVVARWS